MILKTSDPSIQLLNSEFEFEADDHIDEQEECGDGKRAVRYSIKCLDFNMLEAEKKLFE